MRTKAIFNESPNAPLERRYEIKVGCQIAERERYLVVKDRGNDVFEEIHNSLIVVPKTDLDEVVLRILAEYSPPGWTRWLDKSDRPRWLASQGIALPKETASPLSNKREENEFLFKSSLIRSFVQSFPEARQLTIEQMERVIERARARQGDAVDVTALASAMREVIDHT